MSDFLSFILAVAIIITTAKFGGYLTVLMGQPSVLGELLVGIILGPTVLNMLHAWPFFAANEGLGELLKFMAEMGVIFLMMLAGLELQLNELLKSGKVSALAGTLGVFLPLILGYFTSIAFGTDVSEAVFIGLALAATSVSISAQTLMELNVLRTPVGLALLGAAVFDDILSILLLSVGAILFGGVMGGMGDIGITVVKMAAYLVGASLFGLYLLPSLTRYANRMPVSQSLIAFTIVAVLLYAWGAEVIGGMAAITGAFLVGLFLARTPYKSRIESGISALAYGFLVPVFFVNIGLEANMRGISGNAWWFAIAITLVAIFGKIIGCGGGGLLSGFNPMDSLRLGIGMISRGEVGLIVAAFALGQGLLSQEAFSIVIFMVVIATLITPPLLRAVYSGGGGAPQPEKQAKPV